MMRILEFLIFALWSLQWPQALSNEDAAVFSSFENYRYEYDRAKDLNSGKPVPFYFLTKAQIPELENLETLCADAKERSDFSVNLLFRDHPWRSFDDPSDAYFIYVPMFAGVILNEECKPEAKATLLTVLHKLQDYEAWKSPDLHGHPFVAYSSTEAVHERLLNRTRAIFKQGYQYDQASLTSDTPPEELIDYALSQMVSIERFIRPTLQYCQLLSPVLTFEDHKAVNDTNYQFPSLIPPTYKTWVTRPVDFFMAEFIHDLSSPKYAVRKAVFEDFAKTPTPSSLMVLFTTKDNSTRLPGYEEECQFDATKGFSASTQKACHMNLEGQADAERVRLQGLKTAKFAIITRGETPHEPNIYQALSAGAIPVNTIDKTLTMAAPFQCEVPWEEITIRVGTENVSKQPVAVIKAAVESFSSTKLSKMIKIANHFLPDVSISSSPQARKRLVENLLLEALRQCTYEQLNLPRGFSAMTTRCPFTLWTERNLLMRTTFNVDTPPWSHF